MKRLAFWAVMTVMLALPSGSILRAIDSTQKPSTDRRPAGATAPGSDVQQNRDLIARYCVSCHNRRAMSGGLALDMLDLSEVGEHAEVWERVVRKLRGG